MGLKFLSKLTVFLYSMLVFLTLSMCSCGAVANNKSNDTVTVIFDSVTIIEAEKNMIKDSLIAEVTYYINKQANGAHPKLPIIIVEKCLHHDLDICFAMAQTELETNYGTIGAGRETSKRSLFGVGVYKGSKHKGYPNYEIAVEEYILLLKKLYLSSTRTEQTLLKKYTTKSGARYAGSMSYEVDLRRIYNRIRTNTNIYNTQLRYDEKIS